MNETLTVEEVPRPGHGRRPAPGDSAAVAGDVRERFAKDVAGHALTVLHDDGTYRHLRFRHPEHGEYWFDLITWPGCLAINGDMNSFLFSRTDDMFEFFRGHTPDPGYWAEKVRAGSGIVRYSEDRFRQHVLDHLSDAEEYGGIPGGLRDAVREQVLEHPDSGWEDGARLLLKDFSYEGFAFTDAWEWDLTDWGYQFLWCCHAIPWGIARYYEARQAAGAA